MNKWKAQTNAGNFRTGGDFFVMEAIHIEGEARPKYSPGDPINICPGNGPEIPGTIKSVDGGLDIELDDGTQLRLKPAPSDGLTSFRSPIPFETFTGTPIEP